MAIATAVPLVLFFGIVSLLVLNRLKRSKNAGLPLPPGPKGVPILGNVNDLPKPGMLECHHWLQHKDLYGMKSPECVKLCTRQ